MTQFNQSNLFMLSSTVVAVILKELHYKTLYAFDKYQDQIENAQKFITDTTA